MASSDLGPLVAHLAVAAPNGERAWRGWRIRPVGPGANNRLYRATGGGADVAVKFTIRDARDRAGREYAALSALRAAGLALAPAPLLLDRDRHALPVVVQGWLAGEVGAEPPASEGEWLILLEHMVAVHRVTPAITALALPEAVLTMTSAAAGLARIVQEAARIPPEARPAILDGLLRRVEAAAFPDWPAPRPALCHGDPNISNFVRRPGGWAAVDWEYSGWGDPAFELADLMTHPAYLAVPPDRWAWVIATYGDLSGDDAAPTRSRAYHLLMLVWWVARFSRLLYEVPRGLDPRLVARPPDWQAGIEAKLAHYAALAAALLDT